MNTFQLVILAQIVLLFQVNIFEFMLIKRIIFAVFFITLMVFIATCDVNPAEEEIEPFEVTFVDPNFEELIRETLEIPTGKITNQDLWEISNLDGSGREISDISGIEHCSGLHNLFFSNNNIAHIDQLANLVLLENVDLQYNQVEDISPLIDNSGIGIGEDVVQLYDNPLNDKSILEYIPLLQARGVELYSNAVPANPGAVNFVDANFENVIREHLNKPTAPILSSDLAALTNISARNRTISNIYGIEFCHNLDTLDLGENSISDLIPFYYNLRGIVDLKLDNNEINDLTHLRFFRSLESLDISNNYIEDLSDLENMTRLENLSLGYNMINDLTALTSLPNLRYLRLSGNPIVNFSPINGLDSLETLELADLAQFDFNDLNNLDSLKTLYLTNTPTVNLNSITNLPNLVNLIMNNSSLSNIDSLANLAELRRLKLSNNLISDLTALGFLYKITEIDLGDNNISDILPLLNNWGLSNGDYVLLYNNPLNEMSLNTYIPILQERGVIVIY